jgi:poly(A)-specific ribonuclease
MTAELFVKLSAKLYTTYKQLSSSSSITSSIDAAYSDSEDSDSAFGGGAPINPPSPSKSTSGGSHSHTLVPLISVPDNLPPAWYAKQLNRFAVLQHDSDEEAEAEKEEPKPKQWIPGMHNTFWDVYANKLRVNSVEGGVCDLEEGVDD